MLWSIPEESGSTYWAKKANLMRPITTRFEIDVQSVMDSAPGAFLLAERAKLCFRIGASSDVKLVQSSSTIHMQHRSEHLQVMCWTAHHISPEMQRGTKQQGELWNPRMGWSHGWEGHFGINLLSDAYEPIPRDIVRLHVKTSVKTQRSLRGLSHWQHWSGSNVVEASLQYERWTLLGYAVKLLIRRYTS